MAESLCARNAAPTPSPTACNGCRDNFPLPQPVDVFDGFAVQQYIERRTACDRCPAGQKPCLPQQSEAPPPWTPAHHVHVSRAKPVRLLELGTGPHGKMARVEFPDGWSRGIDLVSEADAWHPLFDGLPDDDVLRLRAHGASAPVRQADGTYLQQGSLSFVTKRLSRFRALVSREAFDVPDQRPAGGDVTGYRCAAEVLEALARGYGPHIDVAEILEEVGRAAAERRGVPSRRAAARSFLDVVAEALVFMAKNAKHREFMAGKIATSEAHAAYWATYAARSRTEFVQRMQEGRRKKRAARAAGGAA